MIKKIKSILIKQIHIILFVLIVLFIFRNLVLNIKTSFVDWGDTSFIAWQISTTRDKLVSLDFKDLYTTNSHYPYKNSLFFTDTFLNQLDILHLIRLTHRWVFLLILALVYFSLKFYSKLKKPLLAAVLVFFVIESIPLILCGNNTKMSTLSFIVKERFNKVDFSMYKYNNMDHSIYSGILATRNYLQGNRKYNLWQINEDAEYLEEK